jgi:hypothetical protein
MANLYTKFSFSIPMPREEAEILEETIEETDPVHSEGEVPLGARFASYDDRRNQAVVTHSAGGHGKPEDAALAVSRFLEKIESEETVVFTYANTCSKARVDTFAGGVVIVDREGFDIKSAFAQKREAEKIAEQDTVRVQAEIDVQSDSVEEAARQAEEHLQRPETTATVFDVRTPASHRINLEEVA